MWNVRILSSSCYSCLQWSVYGSVFERTLEWDSNWNHITDIYLGYIKPTYQRRYQIRLRKPPGQHSSHKGMLLKPVTASSLCCYLSRVHSNWNYYNHSIRKHAFIHHSLSLHPFSFLVTLAWNTNPSHNYLQFCNCGVATHTFVRPIHTQLFILPSVRIFPFFMTS